MKQDARIVIVVLFV